MIEKWRTQFAQRYLKAVGRNASRSSSDPDSLNDSETLCHALHLYLAVDDMERVNMLLNKSARTLSQSPSVLASLIQYGKYDLAQKFYRAHWTTLEHSWPTIGIPLYDGGIATNFEDFKAKLQNDDERFFAEVILATMSDELRGENAPGSDSTSVLARDDRDDRLALLAWRMKDVELKNAAIKTKIIHAMITSEKAASLVIDDVAEEFKKINVVQICESNNYNQLETTSPILRRHIQNALAANDVKPLVETIEKLTKAQSHNVEYFFYRMGIPLLEECVNAIKKSNQRWTLEQSKQVAAALRGVAKNKSYLNDHNRAYISLLLVSHVLAGETEKLDKWQGELSENVRSQFNWPNDSVRVLELLKMVGSQRPEGDLNLRMGYLADYLQVSLKLKWFAWQPNQRNRVGRDQDPIFKNVVDSQLVTAEELIEQGPGMVGKLADEGLAKAALAAWLVDAKKEDKAVALWRDAIAAAPESAKQQKNYWRWDLAKALGALGNNGEAQKAAAEVEVGSLEEPHRKEFEEFRSKLNPSAAPAEKTSK